MRQLPTRPLPAPTPTGEERELTLAFARAKAIEDAPVLFPCAAAMMPSPLCILGRLTTGSESLVDSYADHAPAANPDPTAPGPPNLGIRQHHARRK